MIKSIYEKFTAKIILNGLQTFPLRYEQDEDANFQHCYSTLYWKFWPEQLDKKKKIKASKLD